MLGTRIAGRWSRLWAIPVLGAGLVATGGGCSASGDDTAGPSAGARGGAGGSGAVFNDSGTGGGTGGIGGACATGSDEVVSSPVDIIIAIDQSASMGEERDGVIANLNQNLVNVLKASNIDYRVLFVTSNTGLPTGPEFFQFPAGVNSSDALTLLLWTYDGDYKVANTCTRQPDPAVKWKDTLRYESQKVFIVVTDDDPSTFDCPHATDKCMTDTPTDCAGCANNCSGRCPWHQCPTFADKPSVWGGDFPSELYKLTPQGMFGSPAEPKWVFHSIVPVDKQYGPTDPITAIDSVCNYNGNTGETSGVEYQKLSVLTGGIRYPSCDTNYSPVFQSIASTIIPLACKFKLDQSGNIDPQKTNVSFDPGNGSGSQTILKDDTKPCDGGADGWQFTDNNTAILLCGPACDAVKQNANGKVSIVVGCDTQIRVE